MWCCHELHISFKAVSHFSVWQCFPLILPWLVYCIPIAHLFFVFKYRSFWEGCGRGGRRSFLQSCSGTSTFSYKRFCCVGHSQWSKSVLVNVHSNHMTTSTIHLTYVLYVQQRVMLFYFPPADTYKEDCWLNLLEQTHKIMAMCDKNLTEC